MSVPQGMGVATFNLSKELAKLGVQVHLICKGKEEASGIVSNNFYVHRIQHYRRDSPKKVIRLYKKEGFNVVHIHSTSALPTLIVMKALRVPTVVHMHAIEKRYPIKKELIYQIMFTLANKLVSVSKDTKNGLVKKFHLQDEKSM